MNQKVNSGGLEQAPIAWQTRQVMSSDGGPISILYAEVQNLTVNNSYSKRNSTSQDSNLCYLKFRMAGKVIFDLFDKNNPNPIFEHNINLTSQPFGICSHSQYIPDIVAKVIYYEIEQTSRNVSYKSYVGKKAVIYLLFSREKRLIQTFLLNVSVDIKHVCWV